MCGITGFLSPRGVFHDEARPIIGKMTAALVHRGPDSSGCWIDPVAGVALGHRRLSILDLSTHGHQPMESTCGHLVVAFNGEIYNFRDLRRDLASKGHTFRGHSDTEVLLAAVREWGIRGALERFNGMFAFALWDKQSRELHLARDRMGEKPLYYGWMGGTLVFGSELKSLREHPAFDVEIDRDAVALYLRHNHVPAPYSIYEGVRKLPPGTLLTIKGEVSGRRGNPFAYWSVRDVARAGTAEPFRGSPAEAVDQLDILLRDAVALRMEADVPLGAFLSGGIDSSTVVALMQAQSRKPVRTFSIGFSETGYNEAEHAKAVARHLGTDHHELYVTPHEAMGVIPRLPTLYDEPFADSSQIPTFLVSELTGRHVTVALSGDGGDELFGGYTRYSVGRSIWNKIGWMPLGLRRAVAKGLMIPSADAWERFFGLLGPLAPRRIGERTLSDRVRQVSEILPVPSPEAMYERLVSYWDNPTEIVLGAREPRTALTSSEEWPELSDFTHRMMFLDAISYLPDDILVKVDRASMGVSLEARVPLLDHRVVEFAWRLPLDMKVREGGGKWPLRQVLYRYVPQELLDRPKMGFGVPVDDWLRGPLRDWAESLLSEKRLENEGVFAARPIRDKWVEHVQGRYKWHHQLWTILMFQAWLEAQTASSGGGSSPRDIPVAVAEG